jgi:hypothetical protein
MCKIESAIKNNNIENFINLTSKYNECECYCCKNNKIYDVLFESKPKDYEKMFYVAIKNNVKPGYFALQYACKIGNIDIVKYLVENINCKPNLSCLIEAIYYGHLDVMNYLSNECNVQLNQPKDRGLYFFHGAWKDFGYDFFDWLRKRDHYFTLSDLEKIKDNFCFEDITQEQEKRLMDYYKLYFEYDII